MWEYVYKEWRRTKKSSRNVCSIKLLGDLQLSRKVRFLGNMNISCQSLFFFKTEDFATSKNIQTTNLKEPILENH